MERMDLWVMGAIVMLLLGVAVPAWKIGLGKRRKSA